MKIEAKRFGIEISRGHYYFSVKYNKHWTRFIAYIGHYVMLYRRNINGFITYYRWNKIDGHSGTIVKWWNK